MSFSLSNVNGIQMQRDSVLSSLSVACDATTVLPKNNLLYQAPRDGKAAISVDVCNLEVANLTVTDTLIAQNAQIANLGLDTLDGRIINLKQSNGLALGPPKITIGESIGNDAVGLNTVIEILGATNGKTIALPDGGDIALQKQGYGNLKTDFELVNYISSGKEQATLTPGIYYVGAPVTGVGGNNPNNGLGTSVNVDYRNGLQTFTTTVCGDAPPGYNSPALQGDLCVKLEMTVTLVSGVNTITSLKVKNVYLNGSPENNAPIQPVQGFQVGFNYRLVDSNGTANNCAAVLASNTAGDGPYSTLPNPVIIQLAAGSVDDVPSNEQGGTISGYRAEFQYISGTVPGLPPQWIPSLGDINTLTDDTLTPSSGVPLIVGTLQIAANTNPAQSGRIIGKNFDDATTTPGDTIIVDNTPLEMTSLVQQPIANQAPAAQGALQVSGGVYIGNNLQVVGVIGSAEAVFGTTVSAGGSLTVADLATFEGAPSAINAPNGMSTFAFATVSNLTDNRIVLAGNNGLLEDSPALTFDGTLFSVGGSLTTNIVSTETTMSSATVADLAPVSGGLVLSGAGGSLTVSPNITFTGPIPNQVLTLFNGASLTVDGTTTTGSAIVGDLITSGPGVVYTDAANPGQLKNSTNFAWNNASQTLSVNSNISVTQNLKTQNAIITSMSVAGGVVYTDNTGQVFNNSDLIFSAGVTSSLTMTGNTTITGVTNLATNGGATTANGTFTSLGVATVSDTTVATSSSVAALVVAGGVGVGENLIIDSAGTSSTPTYLIAGNLAGANRAFVVRGNNNGLPTPDIAAGQTLIFNDGNWTAEPTSFIQAAVPGVTALAANGDVYIQGRLKVVGNIVLPTGLIIDQATITNSTINSSIIGGAVPAAATFTNSTLGLANATSLALGGGLAAGTTLTVGGSSQFEPEVTILSGGSTALVIKDGPVATSEFNINQLTPNTTTLSAPALVGGTNNNITIEATTANSEVTINAGSGLNTAEVKLGGGLSPAVSISTPGGAIGLKCGQTINITGQGGIELDTSGVNSTLKGEIAETVGPLTINTAGDPTAAPAFGPKFDAVTANAMNVIIDIGAPTGVIPGATNFDLLSMGSFFTTNGSNQLLFTLINSKIQANSRIIATYDSVSTAPPTGPFVPLFCVPVVSISAIQNGSCAISLCNAGSTSSGNVNLGRIHVAILNPV